MKKIVTMLCLLLCFSGVCFADSIPKIYGDAEVRTEEPLGIRVKAQIATATADNENTIEYGFIVSRKVFLDSKNLPAESLTHECPVQYTVGVSKGLVDGEYVDRFFEKNDERSFRPHNFPIIVGSVMDDDYREGAALTFSQNALTVKFTDSEHNVTEEYNIDLPTGSVSKK